ncbi:hypothetical protein [uncultured Rhodoblastus sp.]|uniref:hypothetical protein n=1 Tax=uncultured Rhodoblastus sp. TaxID=543037 RepID=UPI0025EF5496|nr:hypothetical protein [uncultured Rhodoblastus sp.]
MSRLAIVERENPPSQAVSEARDQMRRHIAEIAGLNSERERLTRLASEETAVLQQIGEIGAREIAVFKAWASGGCKGAAPAFLTEERRVASEKLARAQAVAAGAESAIQEIEARLAAAHVEARDLGALVDEAVSVEMLARYAATFADCERKFAAARAGAATCFGLLQALYSRAHELAPEGKPELSLRFLQQLERVKAPDTDFLGGPTNAEVAAAHSLALSEIRRLGEI